MQESNAKIPVKQDPLFIPFHDNCFVRLTDSMGSEWGSVFDLFRK